MTASVASLSAFSLAACASLASLSFLDGGRGGNFAWSSAGARTLRVGWVVSTEVVLVREEMGFNDRLETVEIWDTSDELEPLLFGNGCADGLRAGKAGDGCDEFLRSGSGGGTSRLGGVGGVSTANSDLPVLVRCGRDGGLRFCGRAGKLGLCVGTVPFALGVGTVDAGFAAPGGGGGGGRFVVGGLVKFFCLFRAAMRSARELNLGSSTSAISKVTRRAVLTK